MLSEASSTERTGRITRTLVRAAEQLGTAEDVSGNAAGRGGGLGGAASQQTQQVRVASAPKTARWLWLAVEGGEAVGVMEMFMSLVGGGGLRVKRVG